MFVISIISDIKQTQTRCHRIMVSSPAPHQDLIPSPLVLFAQHSYRITLYQSLFVDNISLFWEGKRETGERLVIWSRDLRLTER